MEESDEDVVLSDSDESDSDFLPANYSKNDEEFNDTDNNTSLTISLSFSQIKTKKQCGIKKDY